MSVWLVLDHKLPRARHLGEVPSGCAYQNPTIPSGFQRLAFVDGEDGGANLAVGTKNTEMERSQALDCGSAGVYRNRVTAQCLERVGSKRAIWF